MHPSHVTTLGKLFTHNVTLFTKQYKLVPAIGWEGNRRYGVALAMRHRPMGSMAWEREINSLSTVWSTAASLPWSWTWWTRVVRRHSEVINAHSSPVSIQAQVLAFLAVFVYPTQAIAFEWKPGFSVADRW